MFRLAITLLALAAVAVGAPVPKELKKKPTLDGTWEAVSMTAKGQSIIEGNTTVWVIKEGKLVRNRRQGDALVASNPDSPIQLKVNTDKPDEVDYTDPSGGGNFLYRARIEVTADEFTIAFGDLNGERPAELKEGCPYFYKFKRIEDKK